MNVHAFANEGIRSKQSRCVYLPDHGISAEENIHTRFFVIIDPVTSKGTFSIPKDNDPRAQAAVDSVALLNKRQEYKMQTRTKHLHLEVKRQYPTAKSNGNAKTMVT